MNLKVKLCLLTSLALVLNALFPSPCLAGKITVAASIHPVSDMAKQVGGDYVDVITIIPSGASPHTFEPKPGLLKKISSAKIFFMIGAGLEYWNEKFAGNYRGKTKRVVLSDGIDLIKENGDGHDKKHEGTHSDEPHANPHIWLDVETAKIMVQRIKDELISADMEHAAYYEEKCAGYSADLDALNLLIKNAVGKFKIKKYVSFHPAWDYFARRYGLESAGVIESVPGKSPTPSEIKTIIGNIRKYGVKAVFAETQFNPKVAEVIAKEAGAKVLFLDPIGGPEAKGRETYIDLMKHNLSVLKEAML
jgi:zinc transport system substrate-binding protein